MMHIQKDIFCENSYKEAKKKSLRRNLNYGYLHYGLLKKCEKTKFCCLILPSVVCSMTVNQCTL